MPGLFRRAPQPQQRPRRLPPGPPSDYPSLVLAHQPRGYWRLGEASGSVVDSSGGGNHGTASGGITRDVTGAIVDDDGGITLDGVSGTWVELTDIDLASTFTYEVWVRRSAISGDYFVWAKNNDAVQAYFHQTTNVFTLDNGIVTVAHASVAETDTSSWHHYVITSSGTTQKIYRDGLDVTVVDNATTFQNTTQSIRLGCYNVDGSGGNFPGSLDEAAVYDYALTASQVAQHYAAGASLYGKMTVFGPALRGYWKLDETSGTVAVDSSGRGRDGTYINTPTLGQSGGLVGSPASALFDSASSEYVNVPDHGDLDLGDGPFSYEFWAEQNGQTFNGVAVGKADGTANVFYNATADKWSVSIGGATLLEESGTTTTGWHHIVLTKAAGEDAILYKDGVDVTSELVGGTTYTNNSRPLTIAAFDGGTPESFYKGWVDEVAVYAAVLTPQQIADHYAAGVSNVTGTGAVSIDAPTVAGTGTETITGSGGVDIDAPTLAGTGSHIQNVTGSGGVDLDAPSVAGTGTETFVGSGGVDLDAPTVAATGTETFAGSGSVDIDAPAVSGTGIETITGSGALDLDAPSVSGTGTVIVNITGTGALDVDAPSISATGAETFAGTGALEIDAPSIAGTATETFTGTGALSIDAPSIAGSGTETLTGSGAVDINAPTVAGTGTETFTGTGAVDIDAPSISGSGSALTGIFGSGAITIDAPTVTGTGAETFTGTGVLSIDAPTVSGTGTHPENVTGTGAVDIDAPSVSGSGTGGVVTPPVPPSSSGRVRRRDRFGFPEDMVWKDVPPYLQPVFGVGMIRIDAPSVAGTGDVSDDEIAIAILLGVDR